MLALAAFLNSYYLERCIIGYDKYMLKYLSLRASKNGWIWNIVFVKKLCIYIVSQQDNENKDDEC